MPFDTNNDNTSDNTNKYYLFIDDIEAFEIISSSSPSSLSSYDFISKCHFSTNTNTNTNTTANNIISIIIFGRNNNDDNNDNDNDNGPFLSDYCK